MEGENGREKKSRRERMDSLTEREGGRVGLGVGREAGGRD